ncbi:MAG: hypothetical protein ABEI99_04285 [Halobaculum sp.]
MSVRAALRELAANYDDRYWLRERLQDRVIGPVLARLHGDDGVSVPDADWDNLFVYDACRADMFEETLGTDPFDDYRRVTSKGSSSPDWLERNFADGSFGDTVCVTANPWTARIAGDAFHALIDVWAERQDDDERSLEERDLSRSLDATVRAEHLRRRAAEVADEYPNKRLIVHYFQPHAPCIGAADGSRKPRAEIDLDLHPGRPLQEGRVDRAAVWEAYCENLQYVHTHGLQLAERLGGKTVFTADHGELFGEWLWPLPMRGYAHPRGLRHPKLVEVPWASLTVGDRRRVRAGETSTVDTDEAAIERRLEELGYV